MKFIIQHIKSIIILVLSISIIVIACDNPNKPKPFPPDDLNEMSPPPPDDMHQTSSQKIIGVVMQYGSNKQGDIDKILIDANGDKIWLHFPPHAARQVLNIAKLHATVTIIYHERPNKKDIMNNELQKVSNNQNEMVDVNDIAPPLPTPGKEVIITGNAVEIKKDDNGRITAFIMQNTLIMLPPHAANDLLPLITSAKAITVKGNVRNFNDGFVNMDSLNLLRPDEIVIDGVTFLVR